MTSGQNRIFVAGLVIGTVAITALVSRPGTSRFSRDQSAFERYSAATSTTRDDIRSGSVTPVPAPPDSRSDAEVGHTVQAVRQSLQRNDLASAKILLDTAQSHHENDAQLSALRQDLQAREVKMQQTPPAASAKAHPGAMDSVRSTSQPFAKTGRLHEHAYTATAAPSRHASAGRIRGEEAPDSSATAIPANPEPAVPPTQKEPIAVIEQVAPAATLSAPAGSEPTDPGPPGTPAAQIAQSSPSPIAPGSGPKTRAQVRAELDRARSDGSLPRFGNPDPAGPGGAPYNRERSTALEP